MIKLYCFPRSGNSREVKLVLAEKEIPFEPLNIREEKVKNDPEYKKASPAGKVPAIIDGDVYMTEAYDINVFLNKRYPQNPLLPADVDPEVIRGWVMKYDKSLCLKIGLLLIECLLKPKEKQKEETKQKLRKEILEALTEVDQALAGKEYLFGTYSLGDIAITPHIAALPRVNMGVDDFPNVKAWFERIKARPNFEKTTS